MNRGHTYSGIKPSDDRGVANMIEYVMVTGIIMVLFITMLLLVHANFVENTDQTKLPIRHSRISATAFPPELLMCMPLHREPGISPLILISRTRSAGGTTWLKSAGARKARPLISGVMISGLRWDFRNRGIQTRAGQGKHHGFRSK